MILLLTGPPAAGKTTIGNRLGDLVPNIAIIDVDLLRSMVRNPHVAPWEGDEGKNQLFLGAQNACLLAQQYAAQGLHVVILDVVTSESSKIYQNALASFDHHLALLLPSLKTCLTRNQRRGQWLKDEEVSLLYSWEATLDNFDQKIDNTGLSIEQTIEKLITLFPT